jgi:hypothetical protein
VKRISRIAELAASVKTILLNPGAVPRPLGPPPPGCISRTYDWLDFEGTRRECRFDLPLADLDASAQEFGAEPELLEATTIQRQYTVTLSPWQAANPAAREAVHKQAERLMQEQIAREISVRRQRLLSRGFVLLAENRVAVDVATLWKWNGPRMVCHRERLASCIPRREPFDRAALAFVQQMRYQVPPAQVGNRYTGQLLPPLDALQAGYGDCDTKALLYAALVDDGLGPEVILFRGNNHMVAGIEDTGRWHGVTVDAFGKQFSVCECSSGVWPPGQVARTVQSDIAAGRYESVRLRSPDMS